MHINWPCDGGGAGGDNSTTFGSTFLDFLDPFLDLFLDPFLDFLFFPLVTDFFACPVFYLDFN